MISSLFYKTQENNQIGSANVEKFVIKGNRPLIGEIDISGAKNAAVAILPATLLAKDVFLIENVPDIRDINSMLQNSRNIVNSVDKHKALISQYEKVLEALNPNQANDNAVKELRGQVESMKSQMNEMLSLLKQKTQNPT